MTNKEKKNKKTLCSIYVEGFEYSTTLDCQVRIWYQGTGDVDSDSDKEVLYDYCGITRDLDIIIFRGLGKIVTTEMILSYS